MRRRFLFVPFTAAVIGGLWMGCTAFDDAVVKSPSDAAAPRDQASVAVDAGCPVARVPTEGPDAAKSGGTMTFVVAAHDITFGAQPDGTVLPSFGYDLDGTCTCKPNAESCQRVLGDASHCDGDLGRDQEANFVLAQVYHSTGVDPASYINDAIVKGARGMIVRVEGYNGERDDAEVTVSLFRSTGPDRVGTTPKPPTFLPDETWAIDQEDVQNVATLQSTSKGTGFVRDGQLVAFFTSSFLPFNDEADINLSHVTLTAQVEPAGGSFQLNNALATGRWPVDDALNGASKIQNPSNASQRLCQDPKLMAIIRPLVCYAADLNENTDNGSSPCNALSMGVAFRATPATLGKVVAPVHDDPCVDAGISVQTCSTIDGGL